MSINEGPAGLGNVILMYIALLCAVATVVVLVLMYMGLYFS